MDIRVLRCCGYVLFSLLVGSSSKASTSVEVRIETGEARAPEATVVLVEASAATGETVARRFKAPGRATLDLDDALDWVLRATAPGYWSRPEVLVPGRDTLTLTLYPAAHLGSTLALPGGEPIPTEVLLTLRDPRALGDVVIVGSEASESQEVSLPEATVTCPVFDSKWSCVVPAGTWDVRVRAESYISHHFWALDLPVGGAVDLKRLRLEKGASVIGRVVAEEGERPEEILVRASPSQAHAPTTRQNLLDFKSSSIAGHVNERGYFILSGMSPGSYRLEASADGFVPAVLTSVPVYENAETEVTRTLVLRLPLEVEFMVSPPLDPLNRQWAVHLLRKLEIPGQADDAGQHVVSEAGTFTAKNLAPGDYIARLVDGDGNYFARKDLVLLGSGGVELIEVPVVFVEGKVSLGDHPLAAELHFGGRRGIESIRMEADERGRFSGYLPREGRWPVEVAAPDVNRRLPDVPVRVARDGIAEVELALPTTLLAGRVVDEQGNPLPGARVDIVEMASQSFVFEVTDENGDFALMGLGEGPVSLEATALADNETLKTGTRIVSLVEKLDPGYQELVARRTLRVTGRVTSVTGQGVPGAWIVGDVTSSGALGSTTTVNDATGVDGSFTLKLPRDAMFVDTWALPVGCSLSYARIDVEATESTQIECNDDAGTLRIEYPADWTADEGARAFVMIAMDGVPIAMPTLRRWAQLNGESSTRDDGVFVVPQMPSGDYSACLLGPSEGVEFLRSGRVSADGCSTGFLRRYGELSLAVGSKAPSGGVTPTSR